MRRATLYGVLTLGAAISVAPFYYIIRLSFESNDQYTTGRGGFSLSSWTSAFKGIDALGQTGHSLIVTMSSLTAILLLSLVGGYSFAKLRPRGGTAAFTVIVAGFMIPVQSIIVPLYLNSAHLHLVGTYVGAITVYTGMFLPFSVFLMTSFFRGIPNELIEAALLDGLGYVAIVFRVLLRLAVPALITAGILGFIAIWNDLLVAMLWLPRPEMRTITAGLATLGTAHLVSIPVIMAASIIQAIPAILLFLAFQRYLIKGLTLGVN